MQDVDIWVLLNQSKDRKGRTCRCRIWPSPCHPIMPHTVPPHHHHHHHHHHHQYLPIIRPRIIIGSALSTNPNFNPRNRNGETRLIHRTTSDVTTPNQPQPGLSRINSLPGKGHAIQNMPQERRTASPAIQPLGTVTVWCCQATCCGFAWWDGRGGRMYIRLDVTRVYLFFITQDIPFIHYLLRLPWYLILDFYTSIYIYIHLQQPPCNQPTKPRQRPRQPLPKPKPLKASTPVCRMTTAQTTGSAMAKSIEYVHHYHRHYQFRSIANIQKRATGGRGLFAGLQDVKHYNVDHGWARRKSETEQPGILGSIWSRYVLLLVYIWVWVGVSADFIDRITGLWFGLALLVPFDSILDFVFSDID